MRIKGKLYFGVAPIALASALFGVPAQLSAQQAPPASTSGRPISAAWSPDRTGRKPASG